MNLLATILFIHISLGTYMHSDVLKSEAQPFKQIEFGFHISYFGDAPKYTKALETIHKDGIKSVRVLDPFTKKLYKDQKKMMAIVDTILNRDFELLMCLSNFPYEDDDITNKAKNFSKESNYNYDNILKIYKYSNRFPPDNLKNYLNYLSNFLSVLSESGRMKHIYFEIGNEPDAPRYFWGNEYQFNAVKDSVYNLLSTYNTPILCCGYTATFVALPNERQIRFRNLIDKDKRINNEMTFSFHYYYDDKFENYDVDKSLYQNLYNSEITEFGIYTHITKNTYKRNDFVNSYKYVYVFANLLNLTYKYNIKKVYLTKLMDDKDKIGTAGYFDADGNPKPVYNNFLEIYNVIKDGYKVYKTDSYIDIIGKKHTIKVALKDDRVSIDKKRIYKTFDSKEFKGTMKKMEWVIYEN